MRLRAILSPSVQRNAAASETWRIRKQISERLAGHVDCAWISQHENHDHTSRNSMLATQRKARAHKGMRRLVIDRSGRDAARVLSPCPSLPAPVFTSP